MPDPDDPGVDVDIVRTSPATLAIDAGRRERLP
jgi:hypothetical protein